MIGIGISYGLTPLIAQHNGRDNYAECGRLLSNSLFINVIAGIILFVLTFLASTFLIGHLHQTPAVAAQAKPFLTLLGLSIIPMLVFNTFKQFAEGLGFTRQAMVISIAGNVLNAFIGIVFVKGLFGISPMGVKGVGYSTLIDRCLMSVVMGWYVFKSPNFKKYLKEFAGTNIDRLRSLSILKIGAPVALQYTFEISSFSIAAVIIGTIGYYQQAAHQIAINLSAMTYMMSSGISAAAAIKSGNYFGGNDHHGLRRSAISSYHIVLAFYGVHRDYFYARQSGTPLDVHFRQTGDSHCLTADYHRCLVPVVRRHTGCGPWHFTGHGRRKYPNRINLCGLLADRDPGWLPAWLALAFRCTGAYGTAWFWA